MISTIRRLYILLVPRERWQLLALVPLLLVAAMLEMVGVAALPTFIALLSDPARMQRSAAMVTLHERFGLPLDTRVVPYAAAVLLGIFVAKNCYVAMLGYIQARFAEGRRVRLASQTFATYLHRPYAFHIEHNSAELLRNATSEAQRVVDLALLPTLMLVRELLVMAGVVVLLLAFSPALSLIVFVALGAASGLFYRAVRARLSTSARDEHFHHGRMIQAVHQGLGAIKEAKVLAAEEFLLRSFREHAAKVGHAARLREFMQGLPRLVLETLAILAILTVAVFATWRDGSATATLPALALLGVAVVRMIPSFNQITQSLNLLRYGQQVLNVVFDVAQAGADREENVPAHAPERGAPLIELTDVRFRYHAAAAETLNGVSMRIGEGEVVGLLGATGSGKTTLINIVLGLLEPTSGQVAVDGVKLEHGVRGWHGRIGYVPQDVYLADETIRRNIGYGLDDADINDAEVMLAVEAAHLRELIDELPAGLDTIVGDRGVRLSGGQRQRIGIARALYRNPRVLVLDEATSALDSETERYIIDAMEALRDHRTIIIVAHRLTTLRPCDRLYFMKRGVVVAEGTYDEVVASSPDFRRQVVAADAGNARRPRTGAAQ